MVIIFAYGLTLSLISLGLIAYPDRAVQWGMRYCLWPYMHLVEVLLNAGFGGVFLHFAEYTRFPLFFRIYGAMLAIIAVGLILAGARLHREYGIWSLGKCRRLLRPLAPVSLVFGIFVMYSVF